MASTVVKKLNGYNKTIVCVPDKSISVRAVILGGFASGTTVVRNISMCGDVMSAVNCMRALGAEITFEGGSAYIVGVGGKPKIGVTLDCGNSATTAKLLIGLLGGVPGRYMISGDRSLTARPFGGIVSALAEMGAKFGSDKLPLEIHGGELHGVSHTAVEMSAQHKSAVLLAGINADGETSYREAVKTRDHTENMLKLAGADIAVNGNSVSTKRSALSAFDMTVPGDISSASYSIALALAVPGGRCVVKNVGINDARRGYIDVLLRSGADIKITNITGGVEPSCDIAASYSPQLAPITVDERTAAVAIDEIPTLCALACFINGKSVFRGLDKLRGKETDRIATTCAALCALGGKARAVGNNIEVEGGELRFGTVNSFGDHRIAMVAAVAGGAGSGCEIIGSECVAVSYPNFFEEVLGV